MKKVLKDYYRDYPTSEEKRKALKKMNNEEIDKLIKASDNIYEKIFLSGFKKKGEK